MAVMQAEVQVETETGANYLKSPIGLVDLVDLADLAALAALADLAALAAFVVAVVAQNSHMRSHHQW